MSVTRDGPPLGNGETEIVPLEIASCPECGDLLYVTPGANDEETGKPIAADLQIDCAREESEETEEGHRFHQSEWQPVKDRIAQWIGAIEG